MNVSAIANNQALFSLLRRKLRTVFEARELQAVCEDQMIVERAVSPTSLSRLISIWHCAKSTFQVPSLKIVVLSGLEIR